MDVRFVAVPYRLLEGTMELGTIYDNVRRFGTRADAENYARDLLRDFAYVELVTLLLEQSEWISDISREGETGSAETCPDCAGALVKKLNKWPWQVTCATCND